MILALAFTVLLNNSNAIDTMKYPVSAGKLIVHNVGKLRESTLGATIGIAKDSNIYSCSYGKVTGVLKLDYGGSLIVISSNDTLFNYSMIDSVIVKKGDRISHGEILGTKKKNYYNIYYILLKIFIESRNYTKQRRFLKELDASKYLIYN